MPRILRNYLISFAIIGLIALAVTMINRYVDERMAAESSAAPSTSEAQSSSADGNTGAVPGNENGGVAPDPPLDGKY